MALENENSEEEEEEESKTLRPRTQNTVELFEAERRHLIRTLTRIDKKSFKSVEENFLIDSNPELLSTIRHRASLRATREFRKQEIEDSIEILDKKCIKLAEAIRNSKFLVVYTGAGISTAANIPDYRGPDGIWTRLDKGQEIGSYNLVESSPTLTHMALFALYKKGKVKHIVSQNCDGLHIRSGIPRNSLSELHGNMFIEICKECKPMRPFVRLFDVTERTSKYRHGTGRRCYVCGTSLVDTIVHFGERGSLKWPINWNGASRAAEKADVILCLGSSLKVLRRYPWLWCMDRPKKSRPELIIVNLQWTPKDKYATLKLNAKTDDVLFRVLSHLKYTLPEYYALNDPLLSYATRLNPLESHTTVKKGLDVTMITRIGLMNDHNYASSHLGVQYSPKVSSKNSSPSSSFIDFKNIVWPRDALYISYNSHFEFMNDLLPEERYPCDCCDPAKRKRKISSVSSSSSSSDDDDNEADEENQEEEEQRDFFEDDSQEKNGKLRVSKKKVFNCKKEDKEEEEENDKKSGRNKRIKTEIKTEIKEEKTFLEDNENRIIKMTAIKEEEGFSSSKGSSNPGWFGKGRRRKV